MIVPPGLAENSPFAVFAAVFLGVLLGQVRVRGVSLGVSGVLFAGLALGAVGFRVDPAYFTLSLVLFIAAVGLLAANDLGGILRAYGLPCLTMALVMTAVAAGFTNFATHLFADTDPWLVRGAFAGAVSSSPGLTAALEAAPAHARDAIAAGYSLSYPVGIVTVILFEQLAPQVAGIDVAAERDRHAVACPPTGAADPADASVPFSLAGFALAIVVGVLVGAVPIPLGPLGSVTLGTAGGTLLAALAVGYARQVGPIDVRMSRVVLTQLREVAIGVFLAAVGVDVSARVADAVAVAGVPIVASAVLVGLGTMVVGYVLAVVVWDLDWIAAAGAISGGMTSTPGLGAAIDATGTEEVGASYGATYPFALLAKVVFSKLLVLLAVT